MLKKLRVLLLNLCYLATPLAMAADKSACLNCHRADELSRLDAGKISAAVTDPGIMAHRSFVDLSQEELAAIAAELAAIP